MAVYQWWRKRCVICLALFDQGLESMKMKRVLCKLCWASSMPQLICLDRWGQVLKSMQIHTSCCISKICVTFVLGFTPPPPFSFLLNDIHSPFPFNCNLNYLFFPCSRWTRVSLSAICSYLNDFCVFQWNEEGGCVICSVLFCIEDGVLVFSLLVPSVDSVSCSKLHSVLL
jgi:hypothetical protein